MSTAEIGLKPVLWALLLLTMFGVRTADAAIAVEARPGVAKAPVSVAHHHSSDGMIKSRPELKQTLFQANKLDLQTGCLAVAIYYEARSESEIGQIAVTQVILNRVESRKYPGSICNVVYQNAHMHNRCQFSFACDGEVENPRHRKAWLRAMSLARAVTCKKNCRSGPHREPPLKRLGKTMRRASHYHATYVSPRWSRKLQRTGRIGQHIFYVSARVWS